MHRGSARLAAPLAITLVLLGAVALPPAPLHAVGSAAIAITKQASATALAGQSISFTLTASNSAANPGAQPEYNVSFRDVLPIGLSYTAGSSTPADAGDPTIYTDPVTGRQTLIWSDVADLQVGSTAAVGFSTAANSSTLPVGAVVRNTGNGYASTAPRTVPAFDASGVPIANASVQAATSNQTATTITALRITKSEPSTEAKLLRGVHDHPTVYTLTVSNTGRAATNAVTVTDYLPAAEEFLGCGQLDNSAAVEYPGAPPLTATPAVGGSCPAPASVDTVSNPPANGSVSYPAGSYTKVVWNLGTLAAGQVATIAYAAGIPLRQNVLFGGGGPTPASGGQAANLDNNTGPATRQLGTATAVVNYAHAAGSYTGPVAGGTSSAVVDDASFAVTANDLRIHKSVTPAQFVAGQLAGYTLRVESGEYTGNSAITITDTLPNGLCPVDDVRNYVTGAPAECDSGAGLAPSLPYQSVTQNADGTFTVVFTPISVPADGSVVISYSGRDRTVYTGGALAGEPTAAGDSFTNTVVEQGTSAPVPATGVTGNQSVRDGSAATQTTGLGTLTKTVAARTASMDCAVAGYGTGNPVFGKGDRVCFQVSVPFATANQTRNAVLTDFLPANTSYQPGSVSYPAANTLDPAQINFDAAGAGTGVLSWQLGATSADGSTEVPAGAVFVVRFSALIAEAASGPTPDKPGNIVKLRSTNSAGVAQSLRDGVDFSVAAAPPVGLTEGVASVNGSTPVNPADTDHLQVAEGDAVTFRIDASNTGSAADANDVPITGLTVWDVLPAGIGCAVVSAISDGGGCTDPGDPAQPSFTGNTSKSAIVWSYGSALAAAATHTFDYTVTIPAGSSVSTVLTGTAAVRSYTVDNDLPGSTTYYPSGNLDTTVPAAQYDAPAAADNSDVYLPDVAVAKGVVSAISEAGNTGAESSPVAGSQATIGEQVSFTVSATVPAHTSVFNASFTDPLPGGLTLTGATASYRPDAGSAGTAALPAGVSFSSVAPATISFPASYDNTTATDQVFSMSILATVAQLVGNAHGAALANTARFGSQSAAGGGSALPDRTATATVTVVEPAPGLTKTNNGGSSVTGGQTISYTVKPSNPAGRPPLHDGWLRDCLPTGLTFAGYGSLPAGVSTAAPVAGDGSNGCATGFTVLAWNLGDLAGGSTLTLTYTATVDPTVSGKTSLVNSAAVSGNSLAGGRGSPLDPGNPAGRQYGASATSSLSIAGATAAKTVTPTSATIGDTVSYTASAVLPPGVNFYNLSLIDQVPNGIDENSISQTSVSCTNADASACSVTSAGALSPTAGPSSSTVIGWYLGDVASATQQRTIRVSYTARVADRATAFAGAPLVNQLHVGWDTAARAAPSSAGASFNQVSATVTATVTVLEPNLGIGKTVSNSTPQPGQSFNYTVTVTNANTTNTSAAYNVTVTDTVPTGVLVDPLTISGGGSISGQTGSGGGTISWSVAGPLARNAGLGFGYSAQLAPSAGLGTGGLANTARVTGYDSLAAAGRHYTGGQSQVTVTPKFPRVSTAKTMPAGSTGYLGESFSWKLTVTDSGAGTAYAVGVVDTLPANWSYDVGSAQVVVNGGPASQQDPALSTAGAVQTLTWTGLGTLNTGTNLTVTYTATPQPGAVGSPGVGSTVNHTNSATANARDATGATGNAGGQYTAGAASANAHLGSADLQLTKAVGSAPLAGGTGSFLLTVRNNGPDTATGPFTVTEPLNNPAPPGVSNVLAAGTGWTCQSTVPVRCQRTSAADTLASGASFGVITVSYNLDSSVPAGTGLPNSASVTAHTYDPNPANNTGSATATVAASADVKITKTVSSAAFLAGAPISYQLAVSNLGPSAAAGPITVDDPLPAGTGFVSAGGAGWTCTPIPAGTIGATLHCSLPGPLAVGATPAAIGVTVNLPASQTAAVSNTATVAAATADPVPANNSATATRTPTSQADLQLQKQHLTSTFVAGGTADYRIEVRNAGESDAAGVQVSDPLPAGLNYASFASADPNWSCAAAGATVTCGYLGSLPAGTSSDFTITVNLASNFTGPAVNTATVSAGTTDPVPGNNSSTDNSAVAEVADLSISKTDSGPAMAGGGLGYALAVHNAGPSDVTGPITVTDPLPAGLGYLSASGTGWSCGYDGASRTVTCTLAAGLAAGADAAAIDLATTVNSDVGPSTVVNTADVSSGTADADLSNNAATDPVTVSTSAALSLTKALTSASPVLAGTDATFQLIASNAGPSDALGVTVTDTLPNYLSLDSYAGTGWSCTTAGQDVVCSRAGIAAGGSAPAITLHALVSAGIPVTLPAGSTTVVNTAVIGAATPGSSSNPAPVPVPVQASAGLSLVKTPKTGTVQAGDGYQWVLVVRNDGPSDAAGPVTVTDTLPGYQSYRSASAGWDCAASPEPSAPSATDHQTVTCTLAQGLAAGAAAPPLSLQVQVDSGAPAGDEINSAAASVPTPGSDGTDTATVTVTRTAALSILKQHTGSASVGAGLDFSLRVHNAGPSVADQLRVTDPLPAGLSYLSATGAGWTCAASAGVLSCDLAGTLAAGADASDITLSTTVGAAAYPAVTNTAQVSSTDPDLPGSATGSDQVTVPPQAALRLTKAHLETFQVGATGHYRLTVDNTGDTESPGPLVLTDTLPAGLTYTAGAGTGWTCAAAGDTVTCGYPGALAAGGSTSLVLAVQVLPSAYDPATGQLENTATVTGAGSPPATAVDSAPVSPLSVLAISKTLVSYADNLATYRITVGNRGPNPSAELLTVTDQLPTGLRLRTVQASDGGWQCAQAVVCVRGTPLPAGASSTITVTASVSAPAGSSITNVASLTAGGSATPAASSSAVLAVTATGSGGTGPGGSAAGSGGLAQTGRDTRDPSALGAGLLLAGLSLLLLGRRRRGGGRHRA
ncbi:MAG: LPXTG cell wall anchor domain-containing protein [Jatrophihabitantaceae bacterium]